jgi:CRP/FNR family transcriptional regulator, cyclic AMP receptor protein
LGVTKRFEGDGGRRRLVEVLKDQKIVGGNLELAEEIATLGELVDVASEVTLIEQDSDDNCIYLILSGSFRVLVNCQQIALRFPGDHVGEMAAIQPSQPRCATVIASKPAAVLRLTEDQLESLGRQYPEIYRQFAKELARRLIQRNRFVTTPREKIRIFVVSSTEALDVARALKFCLKAEPFDVEIWNNGLFRASCYTLECLEKELDLSDFAIAIAQPDDLKVSRGVTNESLRDNVVFEFGFFMGRLGRQRSWLLARDEGIELPSDLKGITTIPYKHDPSNWALALETACSRIRDIVKDLGPIY